MPDDDPKRGKITPSTSIPSLPQQNSNAGSGDLFGAITRILGRPFGETNPQPSPRAPGPGEPGYSQDIRRDIAGAIEQTARNSEKAAVADHPPPENPTQAARALIAWFAGALAFQSVHAFSESSYAASAAYGIGAITVAVIDYKLKAILAGSPRLTQSLNKVAADARWWTAVAMLSLFVIAVSPYIEQRRLPFARYFSPRELTPTAALLVPTSLRLQFNSSGDKPQQIDAKNVEWTWDVITSTRQVPKPLCPAGTFGNGNCSSILALQYDEKIEKTWIIFLAFVQPISGTNEVKINSHGAKLPDWHAYSLSSRKVYIEFKGDLERVILDISVEPKG